MSSTTLITWRLTLLLNSDILVTASKKKEVVCMKDYTVCSLRRALLEQGHPHFTKRNMRARGETIRFSYLLRRNENHDLFLVRYTGKLGFAVWYVSEDGTGKLHLNELPEWHLTYRKLYKMYKDKIVPWDPEAF